MENRPVRFGILGTGDGAKNHVAGFRTVPPDVAVLTSVCGRDPQKACAFADTAGAIKMLYLDQDAFLADRDIDAVIVATPDALHVKHALAAMAAGKHVLVEKPVGITLETADLLAYGVRQSAGLRFGVGFHLRHHAGHRALRELIRDGRVGTVSNVHMEWTTRSMDPETNWRATDGRWFALAALGSHVLDLGAWLVDAKEADVFATKTAASQSGRDLRVSLQADFRDGRALLAYVSVVDKPTKYLRVTGSEGVVECRDTLGGKGAGEIVLPGGERLAFDPVNPYAAQIIDFAAAVREGRDPEANVEAGRLNVAWLEQADQSMNVCLARFPRIDRIS